MKKHILIILLLLFVKSSWAQNANLDYKKAIKIYGFATFEQNNIRGSDKTTYPQSHTKSTLTTFHPTIAFQWKANKNNFHEIELTKLMLNKDVTKREAIYDSSGKVLRLSDDIKQTSTFISVRYEYILNLSNLEERKLVPSLGFSINPYFKQNNYTSKVSTFFPTSETYIGARTFVTPRLTYYLTSKLFIDLNIPLCFFDTNFLIDKEDNPSLPSNQREKSTYNYENFPVFFSGRLGIGLKL